MATTQKNERGIWAWRLVQLVLLISSGLFIGILISRGYDEQSLRQLIRWSARISVSLFCLAFAAKGINFYLQNSFSFWILMNRKYWGISFAIIHFVHLAFLLLLQSHFHPVFELAKTTSLMAGGLAYLFILLMLLTSFPYFSKQLSPANWKRLHTIGGYWIWSIFMTSYWKRILTEKEYLPLGLLLILVLLFRIYAFWKSRQLKQQKN